MGEVGCRSEQQRLEDNKRNDNDKSQMSEANS